MRASAAALIILVFLVASCVAVRSGFSSAGVTENSWVQKAPLHEPRTGLGVAVVNGRIYAIGGSTENGLVGINEEYDPEANTWTYKKPMPTPRAMFRLEVVQNKICCIGGDTGKTLANEVYDPATDTWETRAPMPTPRSSFSTVVFRDRIYVIGGIAGEGLRGTYTGVTEVYDPARDTWETKASIVNASFPETCIAINGKIYVISGTTTYAESVSVTSVYDPETDTWTNKTPMPIISHGAAVVFNDKIYFMGGNSILQIYDPSNDTWSEGARLPAEGVSQGSAFITTGDMAPIRIYVVEDPLRIYDPKKDVWTLGPSKMTNRGLMGVAVLKDKIYAIGGATTDFLGFNRPPEFIVTRYATNEVYTPIGYGTPDWLYDDTAPEIAVSSPQNKTYHAVDVALEFTVNEPVSSLSYALDGENPVEISGNTTLTGLSYGAHNITVHAVDAADNTGTSETVLFATAEPEPEPFPTLPVVGASAATVGVVGVGLLIYLKKRKRFDSGG